MKQFQLQFANWLQEKILLLFNINQIEEIQFET